MAVVLAAIGYTVIRQQLIDERRDGTLRQTYTNARIIRTALNAPDVDVPRLLSGLQLNPGGAAFVHHGGQFFASDVDSDRRQLPRELTSLVSNGRAGHQSVRLTEGPVLIVGVPVAAADAEYYQLVPLGDIEQTLSRLVRSLALAGGIATVLAAGVGIATSGRVLRPLRRIADVAENIATGDLGSRLHAEGDRDLAPLVSSFNEMLDDLEGRIANEARFASDVAHEVRGPLAALKAAVEVVNRRRAELPEPAVVAVDALQEQVAAFNELVLDLLEISRFDAGAARLEVEPVMLEDFVRRLLEAAGCSDVPVRSTLRRGTVEVDRRRLQQMLANLVQNAKHYGGGPTAVTLDERGGTVRIAVEDGGPGIPVAERRTIFDRFARGVASENPGAPRGSGLGLALVAEHAELHGGRVSLEDAAGGGARFVVELPSSAR